MERKDTSDHANGEHEITDTQEQETRRHEEEV